MKALLVFVTLLFQYYLFFITAKGSSVVGFTTAANLKHTKNVVSLTKSSSLQQPSSSSSSSIQYVNSIQRGGAGAGAAAGASSTTAAPMMSQAIMSVLAGSIGGAVGVGIAFPLDTLKTKSQVLSQSATTTNTNASAAAIEFSTSPVDIDNMNMIQLTKFIYREEGISGFFGGVKGMMAGQALIKALAFSANTCALLYLDQYKPILGSFGVLLVAACLSGFITSFLVAPVERIKVMMQANPQYQNELDCAMAVLQTEGLRGLMLRGLGPTLAREVPAYGIYFVVYGLLMETQLAGMLGQFAPLLFGALSGMACWIPTYPIDVVKTLVQNTEGGGKGSDDDDDGIHKKSSIEVAIDIYQEGGIGAFYNGITPKLLRAAINHSVTFYVYGLVMNSLQL